MTDRKATSIRLSAEADRLLDQLAAKLGIKRSSVIEQAIRKLAEGEGIMYRHTGPTGMQFGIDHSTIKVGDRVLVSQRNETGQGGVEWVEGEVIATEHPSNASRGNPAFGAVRVANIPGGPMWIDASKLRRASEQ